MKSPRRHQNTSRSGQAPRQNEKWGPALLPAPTAPSEGSAGVRDLISLRLSVFRSWLTSSGVASDHGSQSEDGFLDLPRPFLDQPSFRTFHPPERFRQLRQKDRLFRRLLPAGPMNVQSAYVPRGFNFSFAAPSPAGGDRIFGPWSSSVRFPFPPMARNRRPDHPPVMSRAPSRSKRNLCHQACG